MITEDDIGGVHVKYLYHCRRQLWLYGRGFRPEHLSDLVQYGEAVHDTSYARKAPVDLGAARLDFVDGENWVHEVKSSPAATEADEAQVIHYCYRLRMAGTDARGGVLHYLTTRRTVRISYTPGHDDRAGADIAAALAVILADQAPGKLARSRCKGCSFLDYCWAGD